MIKAIVKIIDEKTGAILTDGLKVFPHIETYKLRRERTIRKSKFTFDYEVEIDDKD